MRVRKQKRTLQQGPLKKKSDKEKIVHSASVSAAPMTPEIFVSVLAPCQCASVSAEWPPQTKPQAMAGLTQTMWSVSPHRSCSTDLIELICELNSQRGVLFYCGSLKFHSCSIGR